MTAHASNRWNFDLPVDEEVVNEVAECVRYNGWPIVFGIFSPADSIIYNLGWFLHTCKIVVDEAAIRQFVFESEEGPTPEQRERIVELCVRVVQKLDLFGKISPPVELPKDKINIPEVNKTFPPL